MAALFILDARSFRDTELPPPADPFDPLDIGVFVTRSFDIDPVTGTPLPPRTMLSTRKLERLQADLLAAEAAGVTWKFVFVPEPIQNLGVVGASDRFEGYAAERSLLLRFIDEQQIDNVIFVAADIHGTLVNNLTYQRQEDVLQALIEYRNPLAAQQIETSAFEITTGAVAYDSPFGPTALEGLGVVAPDLLQAFLNSLGVGTLDEFSALPELVKNAALQGLIDEQIEPLGYSPIGLQDSSRIHARLRRGSYTAVFTYGWTEFVITPRHRRLRVTTYGIEPYTEETLAADPDGVTAREPRVVSRFVVWPN